MMKELMIKAVIAIALCYTQVIGQRGDRGCCPLIVPLGDGLKGYSVIVPDSGYRENVAIIVNFGTCTAKPAGGFQWSVSWGDGASSHQHVDILGLFQTTHQYANAPGTYNVTAQLCSSPPNHGQQCCD